MIGPEGLCLEVLGEDHPDIGQSLNSALLDTAYPVLEERWGPDDELVRRVRGAMQP